MRSAHKLSQELLGSMAKKAGKIYGTTDRDLQSSQINNNSHSNKSQSNGSNAN